MARNSTKSKRGSAKPKKSSARSAKAGGEAYQFENLSAEQQAMLAGTLDQESAAEEETNVDDPDDDSENDEESGDDSNETSEKPQKAKKRKRDDTESATPSKKTKKGNKESEQTTPVKSATVNKKGGKWKSDLKKFSSYGDAAADDIAQNHDADLEDLRIRTNAFRATGKKGPRATFGARYAGSLVNNREVAGYLGFSRTRPFTKWLLTDDVPVKVFNVLLEAESKRWNTTDSNVPLAPRFDATNLWSHLKADSFHAEDLVDKAESITNFSGSRFARNEDKGRLRVSLMIVRAAHILIENCTLAHVFTGAPTGSSNRFFVDDTIRAEDIYRVQILWTHLLNILKDGKNNRISIREAADNTQAGAELDEDISRSQYDRRRSMPLYDLEGMARQKTAAQEVKMQHAMQQLGKDDLGQARTYLMVIKDHLDKKAAIKAGGEGVGQHTHIRDNESYLRAQKDLNDHSLASFDTTEQYHVLKTLASMSKVMFEDRRKIHVATESEGESHLLANFQASSLTTSMQQADEEQMLATIDKQAPSYQKLEEADIAHNTLSTENFRKMMSMVSGRSAAPRSFVIAAAACGIDIRRCDKTKPSEVPSVNGYEMWYHNLPLMAWQVAGIDFIVNRLNSPMKYALLADATGLGKTVTTIVSLLRRNEERTRMIEEWDKKAEPYFDARLRSLEDSDYAWPGGDMTKEEKKEWIREVSKGDILAEASNELGPRPIYKPHLIVATANAITVWCIELQERFAREGTPTYIRTRLWHGTATEAGPSRNVRIRPSPKSLMLNIRQTMSPHDEMTGRTVILTSYQSFRSRVLLNDGDTTTPYYDEDNTYIDPGDKNAEEDLYEDDEGDGGVALEREEDEAQDDGYQDYEETTQNDGIGPVFAPVRLRIRRDLFDVTAMDESHHCRHYRVAKQVLALLGLHSQAYLSLSATPMINNARDLDGTLAFPFRTLLRAGLVEEHPEETVTFDDYRNCTRFMQGKGWDLDAADECEKAEWYRVLNPRAYARVLSSDKVTDHAITADVIPGVFTMVALRRVIGQELEFLEDHRITLGADIPRFEITTVELDMPITIAAQYNYVYDKVSYQPDDADPTSANTAPQKAREGAVRDGVLGRPSSTVNMQKLRTLSLVNFSFRLGFLIAYGRPSGAKEVHSWVRDSTAFDSYFRLTSTMPDEVPPQDRVGQLLFLVRSSVKLAYLAKMVKDIVFDMKEKLIVYADWPIHIFLVELFLSILQISHRVIRSGIDQASREEAIRDYNSPESTGCDVLILSSRSASESLNLQNGGRAMLIMDFVPIPAILQCVGRVNRSGQRRVQIVKVLTTDCTYDQIVQAKEAEKFMALMSGTMKNTLAQPSLYGLYRNLLGIRSDRSHNDWKSRDLLRKDFLLPETLFRLTATNESAQEMMAQLFDMVRKEDVEELFESTVNAELQDTIEAVKLIFEETQPRDASEPDQDQLPHDDIDLSQIMHAPLLPARPIVMKEYGQMEIQAVRVSLANALTKQPYYKLHNLGTVEILALFDELKPDPKFTCGTVTPDDFVDPVHRIVRQSKEGELLSVRKMVEDTLEAMKDAATAKGRTFEVGIIESHLQPADDESAHYAHGLVEGSSAEIEDGEM